MKNSRVGRVLPVSFLASGKILGKRDNAFSLPFFIDLRKRCVLPEMMDQPGLDELQHREALRGLARINAWSGSASILWPALRALCETAETKSIRVLDIATGAGDVPLRLWRRARRAGLAMQIAGCDRSPEAVKAATDRAAQLGASVRFFALDALADSIPTEFDAITCSLFLHHLERAEAISLLTRTAAATKKVLLINDLDRGAMGYALAWFGTRILTRSVIVHTDGPLSVRAAFTKAEACELATESGLTGASVLRKWPCRYLLHWRKE
jgi:2-polyprenyl-3-methyl-5-hydroxy-6-metoxy-1,4-benzoquinol methylase